MAYAHARGVVHGAFTRDCLVGDGADGVRIADFGAGGALYAAGQLAECGRDAREMAPEVRAGEEPTPAADVFSLGVVGILLCAAPGVAGGPQADTLAEQARRVPGTGLASVLGRAIERDPAARYGSAEELLAHLRRVTTPRPAARPAAAQRRARPPREPDPSAVPEMGYGKALGLMLWALLRSAFVLLLCLGFIAGAVAGGLALAFRDTPRLVAVPSVERKTVAEAVALAKARRLEAAIGRQVYSSDVPEGKVVEQTPFAGKTVREGRSIELVVSRGPARQEVPDLVGASLSRARDLLEAADLQLGAVSRDPGSPKPADEVLTQNPQAGKPVPVDTEVNVTVSGKRGAAPPPGEPDTGPRAADISVVVPEGPVVQRVRVEVHYPSGRYTTAYERVHRPGETARTHVVASGPASVQIFIDGDLIDECELEPEP
jgi:serine/threonine-protein kinase